MLPPMRPFGRDDDSCMLDLVRRLDVSSATKMLRRLGFVLANATEQDYQFMRTRDERLEAITMTIDNDRFLVTWTVDNWEHEDIIGTWLHWLGFLIMVKRGFGVTVSNRNDGAKEIPFLN
jgi:hypothetical protein